MQDDRLSLNPSSNYSIELIGSKSEEFADYLSERLIIIRSGICQQNMHTTLISSVQCDVKLECFDLVDAEGMAYCMVMVMTLCSVWLHLRMRLG